MPNEKRPIINVHRFKPITGKDRGEVRSYGLTETDARASLSDPDKYAWVGCDQIEYRDTDMALAVAGALSGEWEAVPGSDEHPECWWYLNRSDGLSISMRGPSYEHKNQVKFSLTHPRDSSGSWVDIYEGGSPVRPSIKCGIGKEPAQMARDIERRLLPEAERVRLLILAEIGRREGQEKRRLTTLKLVAEALGKPATGSNGEPHFLLWFDGGKADVGYSGSVRFEISTENEAQALKVARLVREIVTEKKKRG